MRALLGAIPFAIRLPTRPPTVLGPSRGTDRLSANIRRDQSQFELVDDLDEVEGQGTTGTQGTSGRGGGGGRGGRGGRGRSRGGSQASRLPPASAPPAVDTQKGSRISRSGISKANSATKGTPAGYGVAR